MIVDSKKPLFEFLPHVGKYSLGSALGLISGIITLPLMTRLLSKEEYGIMSLVFLTLSLLGMFGRMGFQQATTRLFHDYKAKGKFALQEFCTNMIYGVGLSSIFVIIIMILGILFYGEFQDLEPFWKYMNVMVLAVFFRTLTGVGQEVWRAEKRQSRFVATGLISTYGSLFLGLGLFLWFQDLWGVFIGNLLSSVFVASFALWSLIKEEYVRRVHFSQQIIREGMKYGIPLALSGMASFILGAGDRYIIQYFMNAADVAQYSVVNDLSNYVGGVILGPVRLALVPLVFSLWVTKGAIETGHFLSSIMKYLWMLLFPAFAGFVILGEEIIEVVASDKYTEGYYLVPFLAIGAFLGHIQFLFSLGISVKKNTAVLARFTGFACLVNIVFNIFAIQFWGLAGVAVVTIISYGLLLGLTYFAIYETLPLAFHLSDYLPVVAATVIMGCLLFWLPVYDYSLTDLFYRVGVGVSIYSVCLLMFHTSLRRDIKNYFFKNA